MIGSTRIKDAVFSKDRLYRYTIFRQWKEENNLLLCICLNPSVANETNEDLTLNRCVSFAKDNDFDGVYITNLFSYVSTDPKELYGVDDPIGEETDAYIVSLSGKASSILIAWGNGGRYLDRANQILNILPKEKIYYLKLNATGEPSHPSRLPRNLKLKKYPE